MATIKAPLILRGAGFDNTKIEAQRNSTELSLKPLLTRDMFLPFNGPDAATSTTDLASPNRGIDFQATAQLDTARKKFGSAAVLFDGDSDYLQLDGFSDMEFGSGQFHIRLWAYLDEAMGSARVLFGKGGGTAGWSAINGHEFISFLNTDSKLYFQYFAGSVLTVASTNVVAVSGGWHQFDFVNDASNFTMYVDNVSVKQVAAITITRPNFSERMLIGTVPSFGAYWNGSIDMFQVRKGGTFTMELETSEPDYWDSASPVAYAYEIDSGDNATVWDMSTIQFYGDNLSSEAGTVKMKYAASNTDYNVADAGDQSTIDGLLNGSWLTEGQAQAESDQTGRYLYTVWQFAGDGTQDASLQEFANFIDMITPAAGGGGAATGAIQQQFVR